MQSLYLRWFNNSAAAELVASSLFALGALPKLVATIHSMLDTQAPSSDEIKPETTVGELTPGSTWAAPFTTASTRADIFKVTFSYFDTSTALTLLHVFVLPWSVRLPPCCFHAEP